MHGVTHTIDEIRERGVPGFEVEVIGTDPHVDRRLSAVAEVEIPFYAGLKIGVPSLPAWSRRWPRAATASCTSARPGRRASAAAMIGRVMRLPIAGSYHTELAAYAGLRSRRPRARRPARIALGAFYGGCDTVLSPSAADASLAALGIAPRADRPLGPRRRRRPLLARRCATGRRRRARRVLYAGRLTREKGVDLLADASCAARDARPAAGPGARRRRARGGRAARAARRPRRFSAGSRASSCPRLRDADLFLFCSQTDTFGQVVLEAQASGLPVVAVARAARWS